MKNKIQPFEQAANDGLFETSTRLQALEWWHHLHILVKMKHSQNYFTRDDAVNLTGREIEEIWKKETQESEMTDDEFRDLYEETTASLNNICKEVSKPNQKQFKQLNKELHLKHLNKFSLFDKFEITALNLLQLPLTVDELHSITTILKECRNRNKVNK